MPRTEAIPAADADQDRVLREPEVGHLTGVGKSARYELEKRGEFPARFKLTDRAVGWSQREVLAWIHSRRQAAKAPAAAGGQP